MRPNRLLWLGLAVMLSGCRIGTLPNPNDPKDVGSLSPENMRGQMHSINEMLQGKVARGQITDAQANQELQVAADRLLGECNLDKVDASKIWEVAEVMLTAQQWDKARPLLEAAVEWAKSSKVEDRRVNDSLRLARVFAKLGDVPRAVKTARSVFDAKPQDSAPILNATLLEIVPAAQGKGHEVELARLLEDAMIKDFSVKVDLNSVSGQSFLFARPHHLRKAWQLIQELYKASSHPELIDEAHDRLAKSSHGLRLEPTVRA